MGRLDLKSDRKASTLRVAAAHLEPGADAASVAGAVVPELHRMRTWLGFGELAITRRGALSRALAAEARSLR